MNPLFTSMAGLCLLAALTSTGCGDDGSSAGGKPIVVASIYPYAAIAEQLAGNSAQVVCLLPPGASPHAAPDTADNMAAVAKAKLIIVNGGGLDYWAGQAAKAAKRTGDDMLNIASVLEEQVGEIGDHNAHVCTDPTHDHGHSHVHVHGHDHHHHHHHDTVDTHFWLDPALGRVAIEEIADRLIALLPDEAAAIQGREAAMIESLTELEAAANEKLAAHAGQGIVTFHDAFGRLAERFGLEVVATLTPMNAPGDVTPESMARVLAVINQHQLNVVFSEPQFSPDAANMITQKTGVQVMPLDPLGDPMNEDRDTYAEIIGYNVDVLVAGLSLGEIGQ